MRETKKWGQVDTENERGRLKIGGGDWKCWRKGRNRSKRAFGPFVTWPRVRLVMVVRRRPVAYLSIVIVS